MNTARNDLDDPYPTAPLAPERPKGRWLRRLLTTGFILLLMFGLVFSATWYGVRKQGVAHRDQMAAELDATEPGWRMDDLIAARAGRQPAAGEDVCGLAKQAAEKFPNGWRNWTAASYSSGPIEPNRLHDPDRIERIRKVRQDEPEPFAIAGRIRTAPGGVAPVDWSQPNPLAIQLPHLDHLRKAASLLDSDAQLAAHDRRGSDSADAVLGILAATRGINDEPTIASQLARMTIMTAAARGVERTLGLCEVNEDQLAEFQTAIAAEADQPRMLWALQGERALLFRLGDSIDQGTVNAHEALADMTQAPDGVVSLAGRMFAPGAQAVFLEVVNKFIAAAKQPHGPKRIDEMKAIEAECLGRKDLEAKPLRTILPAVALAKETDFRTVALCRITAVALACERYRLKNGKYPESLPDLPKALLADIPNDPHTDEPVKYKRTDTGAVVYSVGPDRTDNGGKLGSSQEGGADVGFHLFLPAHRRTPPPPKPAVTDQNARFGSAS